MPTAEGRALPPVSATASAEYRYEYQQVDHLGNLRVACRCGEMLDANGQLVPVKAREDQRSVVQESHYDPWGLNLADIDTQPGSSTDWWQFTGQERDYGAYTEFALRQYDASLGRFTSVDPMADAFEGISPFNYADNSPIANLDLYGLQAVPTVDPIRAGLTAMAGGYEGFVVAQRLSLASRGIDLGRVL